MADADRRAHRVSPSGRWRNRDAAMTGPAAGALAGVRVIDLTRVLGGPFGTQILADHGADVIKVEPPQGDEVRDWGPPFRDATSSYYTGLNRNKRTIALDLAQPGGRDVLLRLLEDADVMIENFKSGTLERWGIDYASCLNQRFPRLVYCRLTGFGDDGPLGGLPGYDAAVQAAAGVMSINGSPESAPLRVGSPIVDIAMGHNAVIGILLALRHRDRTGEGQALEATLYDAAISLLHPYAANYLMSGDVPVPTGNAHPNISPYDCFPTGTKLIFLAVGNDNQFRAMCRHLEADELADDPRFVTNAQRVVNRTALRELLVAILARLDATELADQLMHRGVPAAAVLNVAEVLDSDHAREREMIVSSGAYRGTGFPTRLRRSPASLRFPPRPFAADTEAVLREAGYSAAQVRALAESGAAPTTRRVRPAS